MADADQGPEEQTTQSMEGPRGAPIQGPSVRAGDVVGPYEIVEEIGRGGMGVVYRARHRRLGNDVALKCPYPRLAADPANRKRFLREARAYSRLSGPNIVHVFDTFEHAGLPWLALQLVEGPSLEELLETHGKIDPRTALSYAVDIANALDLAHKHGVLHRDIKPRNVLITQDDRVLLTDFGLARFIPSEEHGLPESTQSSLTETGAIVGTPRYMAPEQALGKTIDPRTDIYSWGAVVYEMLTGEPLFKKKKLGSLIDEIMHHEPEPISRFTYEVPEEFERIIRKAIAKDPRDRFQSTADLLVDLRTLRRRMDGTSAATAPKSTRTRNASLIAGGAAAVLIGVSLWSWLRPQPALVPLPVATPRQVTSADTWNGEPALSPDGSRIAYVAKTDGGEDIFVVSVHGGNPFQLTTHPGNDRNPAWFPDGSTVAFTSTRDGSTDIWRVNQFGGGETLLVPNATHPTLSPDGNSIGFTRLDSASNEYRLFVASVSDPSSATRITTGEDGLWSHERPAWSPDGTQICYGSREGLWTIDVASKRTRRLTEGREFDSAPAWGHAGRFVYFASHRDGTTAIWRVDGNAAHPPQRVTLGSGPESEPTVSADGSLLAYSTQRIDFDLTVMAVRDGSRHSVRSVRDEWQMSLSPDGGALVFVSDREAPGSDLWRQKLVDGRPVGQPTRLTHFDDRVSYPRYAPDGAHIAFYVIHGDERNIWTVPADGGEPTRITDGPAADLHPTWSPDGDRLVFVSERLGGSHIWIMPMANGLAAGEARAVTSGPLVCLFPCFSPDGRHVAFIGTSNGASEVWLVPSDGTSAPRILTSGADPRDIRWTESGRMIVSGSFGSDSVEMRTLDVSTGASRPYSVDVPFGSLDSPGTFDLTPDGSLLVYTEQSLRGDVWALRTETGAY